MAVAFGGQIIGEDSGSVQLELKRTSSGTDGNTSIKFNQPLGDGFLGVNGSGSLCFGTAPNLLTDNKFLVDRSGNSTFAGAGTFGNAVRINGTTTTGLVIASATGSSNGLKLYNNSSTDNAYIYNHFNGNLEIGTNSATVLTINGTSSTFAGQITASKNQNATSSFTFQNTDTTGTSVRTHLNATAGNRSIRLEAIHSDYSYVVSNNARMYFQTNSGSNNPLFLDGNNATFGGGVTVNAGNGNQLILNNAGDRFTQISLQNNGTTDGALWVDDTDNEVVLYANTGKKIEFHTNGEATPKLTISTSGTVSLTGDKTIDTSSSLRLNAGGGTLFLDSSTNTILRTGGTTPALSLSSSQNADFAGSIIFSSNTAYVEDYAIRKGSDALVFSGGSSGYYFNGPSNAVTDLRITGTGTIFMSRLGGDSSSNADVRFDTSSKELYYLTSSRRYKTNIVNLESSLDKINLLRPVRYKDINTKKSACGLIAEETIKVIPEVVFTKEIEGFNEPQIEGINYTDLVPYLIKSIQELKKEVDLLKQECKCK